MQALNTTMIGRAKRAAARTLWQVESDSAFERTTSFAKRNFKANSAALMLCKKSKALAMPGARSNAQDALLNAVMAEGDVLAIPDVARDSRFREARGAITGFLGAPVHGDDGAIAGVLCVTTDSPRIWSREDQELMTFLSAELEATMRLDTSLRAETKRADQQSLIAREYHHRVRNAYSVSSAIVVLSGGANGSVQELIETTSAQLSALADAHTSLRFEQDDLKVSALVASALQPYKASGATITAEGPELSIGIDEVVSLSLILTELATNSTKHGALGKRGWLDVSWTVSDGEARLHWRETCREARSTSVKREGSFGGTMVDLSVSQLGATLQREWRDDGLDVTLSFSV